MVTTGISALRKACFHMTTRSESPLARAVLIYSSPSTSRNADRVKRAMMAATVAQGESGQDQLRPPAVNPATGNKPR